MSGTTYVYEIPLSPTPQTFSVTLAGSAYTFRLIYRGTVLSGIAADLCGWVLDIGDGSGSPIACGIPLVTGTDLIGQYRYLGIGGNGSLVVQTDGNPTAVPTFANLGTTSHLYYIMAP